LLNLKGLAAQQPAMQQAVLDIVEFLRDEGGQDVFEYALIASLAALGSAATIKQIAPTVTNAFNIISNDVTTAL
jgi:Flp pilus assembly pilin Flp